MSVEVGGERAGDTGLTHHSTSPAALWIPQQFHSSLLEVQVALIWAGREKGLRLNQ